MFYRRKVLLGLLEVLDRGVPKVDLQKYLFLVCVEQEKPAYDFIPYRFGCFSFQADADKRTLTKYGAIKEQEQWALGRKKRYMHLLKAPDQKAIQCVVRDFGHLHGRDLIRYVYRTYPYYAINSELRHEILNSREQAKVDSSRPTVTPARLFTIGYEGQSLERYLNQLIAQSVGVLCDVRRNPVSMKYGFSKRQLRGAVEALGMAYVHIPELGIDSSKRKNLGSPDDYKSLFDDYIQTTLKTNTNALTRITDLIRDYGRVALTCFEADHKQCHRGCVAEALKERPDFRHRVAHL